MSIDENARAFAPGPAPCTVQAADGTVHNLPEGWVGYSSASWASGVPFSDCITDITYIPTGEGWLYLAAAEDLYSSQVVGWSTGERIDSRLVADALEMAVSRRLPGEGLVVHSDRGSQYASEHYQRLLAGHGIMCGTSRRANCWDDAPMESVFATLEKELVHDEDYATREEAGASLFECIEVFYNRVRRHSSLGDRPPVEYERAGQPLTPRSTIVGKSTAASPRKIPAVRLRFASAQAPFHSLYFAKTAVSIQRGSVDSASAGAGALGSTRDPASVPA